MILEFVIPLAVIIAFITIHDKYRMSQLDNKFNLLEQDICKRFSERLDEIFKFIKGVKEKTDDNQVLLLDFKCKNEIRRGTDELKSEAIRYAPEEIRHIVVTYAEFLYSVICNCYYTQGENLSANLLEDELRIVNNRMQILLERLPEDYIVKYYHPKLKKVERNFINDTKKMVNGPLNAVRTSFISLSLTYYRELLEVLVKTWGTYSRNKINEENRNKGNE